MRRHDRFGPGRRAVSSDDRGAMLIEFALIMPFLMLIAMGIVEYGMAWKSTTDVNAAARDAARAGTRAPAYDHGDREIVRQIAASMNDNGDTIERIVVYKASGPTDSRPANGCLTLDATGAGAHGIPGVCNVYGTEQLEWVKNNMGNNAHFVDGGACPAGSWDRAWCPTSRAKNVRMDNLDYVGVFIVVDHESIAKFGFGDQMIRRGAVFRVEPPYDYTTS